MKMKLKYIAIILVVVIAVAGFYFYSKNNQTTPSGGPTAKFEQYAVQLGLNASQFNSCLDSGKFKTDIENDVNDGQGYGVQGTPTFFINGKELVGALPFTDFQTAIQVQIANETQNQIRTGTNPPLGSANTSLVIVMFSDYQCPYCKAAEPTIKQVMQQFSGKVVLYYRDFPIHAFSEKAAEASKCAGEQGKYWDYHDLLFEKQDEWSAG